MKKTFYLVCFVILTIIQSANAQLPQTFDPCTIEEDNKEIAEFFAPTIKQMAETSLPRSVEGRADLIVSPFYDNDDFSDNWDNLDQFPVEDLLPVVYYSVVWTEDHWIVTYLLYHARDYAPIVNLVNPSGLSDVCCRDNHESDMEGAIFIIGRTSEKVEGYGSTFHNEIYLRFGVENQIPTLFSDDRTHAVMVNLGGGCMDEILFPHALAPCDDCKNFVDNEHITYTHGASQTLSINENNDLLSGTGTYILEDIFGSSPNALVNFKDDENFFKENKFVVEGPDCQSVGSRANAPWGFTHISYSPEQLGYLTCATDIGGTVAVGASVLDFTVESDPLHLCRHAMTEVLYNPYEFENTILRSGEVLEVGDDFVDAVWESHPSATSFKLRYRKLNANDSWTYINNVSSTAYTFLGLYPDTEYEFEIRPTEDSCWGLSFERLTARTTCSMDFACDPCYEGSDIIISSDQDFILSEVGGSIIVQNNSTLTISHDVQFIASSRIEVRKGSRLIIDGATLTKCPYTDSWKGVQLERRTNNGFTTIPGGAIDMKNGAIIEFAEIGINTEEQVLVNGTNYPSGGGVVNMNRSEIRECGIGIKFGPPDFRVLSQYAIGELSRIENRSSFENCDHAIELNGSNGLRIQKSTFRENCGLAIEAWNSAFDLHDNTVLSEINSYAEYHNIHASTITDNTFINTQIFTESQGNMEQMLISGNEFLSSSIYNSGELWFDIQGNDFYDSEGFLDFNSTGEGLRNFVQGNAYYNTYQANRNAGINDMEYLRNCFQNTDLYDIYLFNNASIAVQQGISDLSAGNYFSYSGHRIESESNSKHFAYYTRDYNKIQSRKHPSVSDFYDVVDCDEEAPESCGTNTTVQGNLPDRHFLCNPKPNENLENFIKTIQAEIDRLLTSPSVSSWKRNWLIARYKKCIDRLTKITALDLLTDKGLKPTIRFLQDQGGIRYNYLAYSLMVRNLNIGSARTFLNGLASRTSADADFVFAQNIYLDYLEQGDKYVLSYWNKRMLKKKGLEVNPLSGFTRAVYYRMTGEKIVLPMPDYEDSKLRSTKNVDASKAKGLLFPNPTDSDVFSINLEEYKNHTNLSIEVVNLNGEVVLKQRMLQPIERITIPGLQSGIYVLMLSDSSRQLHSEKFIKL